MTAPLDQALSRSDLDFIIESLDYTRFKFEAYAYPDESIRMQRLTDVRRVTDNVRAARRALKAGAK